MIEEATALVLPIIKQCEGLHKRGADGLIYPYLCPAGYPTQGYGILVASLSSPPITVEEAERRLIAALPYYMNQTLALCPQLSNPASLAAITDFCFNLGASRLSASTLRRKIQARDAAGAKEELAKWVFGGGKKLPGLVTRRALEASLFKEI